VGEKKKLAQGFFYLTSYIQWDVHALKFPCNTWGQGNDFFGGKFSPFCYKYLEDIVTNSLFSW
jgi:hypothetical protein